MQQAWPEMQARFAAAVVDETLPTPTGVIESGAGSRRAGFSVYRNNSMVSLIEALQERFPVTCRLVGDEFFRAMARSYVSRNYPRSPLLIVYGDELPVFLESFVPARDVNYLADVARLELAWSESYHAPEDCPLQPRAIADVAPATLLGMKARLHPSIRILRSPYPVADIWTAHQETGPVKPPASWRAQDVLIVRPDADVHVHVTDPGMHVFIAALLKRMCVQDAAEAALAENPAFDSGESIVFLLRAGAIVALDQALQEITR